MQFRLGQAAATQPPPPPHLISALEPAPNLLGLHLPPMPAVHLKTWTEEPYVVPISVRQGVLQHLAHHRTVPLNDERQLIEGVFISADGYGCLLVGL